jgi:quercetin dioxygenase-like cupin family protein
MGEAISHMRRREFISLLGGAALSKGMEKTMRRFTLLLLVVGLLGGTHRLAAQETVETRSVTSEVKIEEVIFGHLTELNGKFKLRATELTFAPDGYVGVHHHIGPGIRYIISGELSFAEGGQETVYKAGEYFFETGNIVHTAQNKTNVPLRILVVEILPKDWTAPAMIAPRSR